MEEKISEPKLPKEYPNGYCDNPQHEPASLLYRSPGTYRHTCPGCGKQVTFDVPMVSC